MKRKVFAAVLISILVCGIGLFLLTRRTAEDHLADADRFMAEGAYGRAGHEYEKAVGKGRRDVETLLKLVDAIGRDRVESAEGARRSLQKLLWATDAACRKAPTDPDVLQRRMDIQVYCALELNITAAWRQIRARTDRVLKADPDMLLARKYRGMAAVRLGDLGSEMDLGSRTDLDRYVKAHPDDVEAIHHLAWWHILESRQREARGEIEAARQLRGSGLRITGDACQRQPASTRAHLNHVQMLLAAGQRDQARALLREQERKLLERSGSARDMLELTYLIARSAEGGNKKAPEADFGRMEAVCDAMSGAFPDDARADVIKARILATREQTDAAIALFDGVRQRRVTAEPLAVLTQASAHAEALSSQITLWLDQIRDSTAPERRDEILTRVEGLIDEAAVALENTVAYPRLVGRFEGLRGEWLAAVESLRKADEILQGSDVTVRLQLAAALRQTGRLEEAASILEELMNSRSPLDLAPAGDLMIHLKIEEGALDDAGKWLERLRTVAQPDDGQIASLQTVLASAWMARGEQQHKGGQRSEAIESLRRAQELAPGNPAIRQNLAMLHDAEGDYVAALELLRGGYESDPQDRNVRDRYARYEVQHGDKQAAVALRRRWAKSDPDDLENQNRLVSLLSAMKQHDEALRLLDAMDAARGEDLQSTLLRARLAADRGNAADGRKVIEEYMKKKGDGVNSDDWITLSRFLARYGQTDNALNAARQAVRLAGTGSTVVALELIELLIRLDRLDEAESQLRKLYETFPGDRNVSAMLVRVLVLGSRSDDAQKVLEGHVKEHGADVQTYLMESNIAVLRSDIPEALERLDFAARLAPRNPEIHYQRARLLAGRPGNETAVRKAVEHALALDPTMSRARILLARLSADAGQTDRAIAELEAVLQADNRHNDARRRLSELYVQSNRYDEARTLLAESVRMFPDVAHWPSRLAELAQRMGNFDDAATQLKRVFELDSSASSLHDAAAALNRAGRYRETLDLLSLNAELTEADRTLNSVRGWALSGLGQSEEALRVFDEAARDCRTLSQAAMVAGHMVRALGRELAITRLEASMRPRNEVVIGLALASEELKTGKAERGLKRLKRIESALPENSINRSALDRQLAMALHATKDLEAAREAYARVIRRNRNDVEALFNFAELLSGEMNLHEQALKYIGMAMALAPNDAHVLDSLGSIQFRQGSPEQAEHALRRSVQIARMPTNCLHLGLILIDRHGAESRAEALKWLQLAVELATESEQNAVREEAARLIERLNGENQE